MTWTNGIATLHHADARDIPLPDQSVHCVVTSPPYWGLRSYGLGDWEGGDAACSHDYPVRTWANDSGGQLYPHNDHSWPNNTCGLCGAVQTPAGIGLEPTLAEHLANIVAVGREVWRVLRDDGSFWLNYGDAYSNPAPRGHFGDQGSLSTGAHGEKVPKRDWGNMPPKNLMGLPWRIAFALQDDGWYLRSAIVWHKPNPMPESVRDRPTSAYEMVFLLTKQPRYFYDAEAVRTVSPYDWVAHNAKYRDNGKPNPDRNDAGLRPSGDHAAGANARNVWTIPTQGRPDAHFATFPDELPRRCILAGTSERGVCAECGAQWARVVERVNGVVKPSHRQQVASGGAISGGTQRSTMDGVIPDTQTTGWQPTCECNAATVPAKVLDPFIGSGTTCAVAQSLGRHSAGLDLNREYLAIAQRRIEKVSLPMALP